MYVIIASYYTSVRCHQDEFYIRSYIRHCSFEQAQNFILQEIVKLSKNKYITEKGQICYDRIDEKDLFTAVKRFS